MEGGQCRSGFDSCVYNGSWLEKKNDDENTGYKKSFFSIGRGRITGKMRVFNWTLTRELEEEKRR